MRGANRLGARDSHARGGGCEATPTVVVVNSQSVKTTTSSITTATRGTRSWSVHDASCPSECANGPMGSKQIPIAPPTDRYCVSRRRPRPKAAMARSLRWPSRESLLSQRGLVLRGGDDGGVSRRPCVGLRLFRRRSAVDPLRQSMDVSLAARFVEVSGVGCTKLSGRLRSDDAPGLDGSPQLVAS